MVSLASAEQVQLFLSLFLNYTLKLFLCNKLHEQLDNERRQSILQLIQWSVLFLLSFLGVVLLPFRFHLDRAAALEKNSQR